MDDDPLARGNTPPPEPDSWGRGRSGDSVEEQELSSTEKGEKSGGDAASPPPPVTSAGKRASRSERKTPTKPKQPKAENEDSGHVSNILAQTETLWIALLPLAAAQRDAEAVSTEAPHGGGSCRSKNASHRYMHFT